MTSMIALINFNIKETVNVIKSCTICCIFVALLGMEHVPEVFNINVSGFYQAAGPLIQSLGADQHEPCVPYKIPMPLAQPQVSHLPKVA